MGAVELGEWGGERGGGGTPIEWRAWPAAGRPVQAAAVGLAVVSASFGLGAYGGDLFLGIACLAVLFLSLSAYFLPTRYRMDEEGVEVSRLGRIRRPWRSLRSFAADGRGITLSPYRRSTWLEPYRSLRLLYQDNRDEVLAAVAARLEPRRSRKDPSGE